MANTQDTLILNDEDKKALIAAVEKRLDEKVNAHLATMLKAMKSAITKVKAPPSKELVGKTYWWFWVVAFLLLPAAVGVKMWLEYIDPEFDSSVRLKEPHHQIAILAFVVALAAYLSGVAREIVKRVDEIDETEKNLKQIVKLERNLALITGVEINLVILGVLAAVRLVADGMLEAWIGYPIGAIDAFLLIYLALIIVSLGCLHGRQWYLNKPANANRERKN